MAQYVLGFEISMKESILVQVSKGIDNFVKNGFNLPLSQGSFGLTRPYINLKQISLYEVEY
jgi:hypothetical protein